MKLYAVQWRNPIDDPPRDFISVVLKLSEDVNDNDSYEIGFYDSDSCMYYGHGDKEFKPKEIIEWCLIPGEL